MALVRQIGAHSRARVIAVRALGPWAGADDLSIDGIRWRVVRANSVLATREALADHDAEGPEGRLVLLTPLSEQELGLDALARVARQKLWELQAWELLRDLFRARDVDPRVARQAWLVNALLDYAPATGYRPVRSGILDLDTAWTEALKFLLGMPGGAPDVLTILRWSMSDSAATRWSALPEDARAGVGGRFEQTAGDLGRVLARAADAGHASRLVALGLVADVLWPEIPVADGALRDSIAAARVRLEPVVGGVPLSEPLAQQWAQLAVRVLGELALDAADRQRAEAEATLGDLRAESAAALSRVLPGGAARRASAFARAIIDWLNERATLGQVLDAERAFIEHANVARDVDRIGRATMAVRLVRAMSADRPGDESGFGGLVRQHVQRWSWADSARKELFGGDVSADLAGAYAALLLRAREWRDAVNLKFAETLVVWNSMPVAEPEVVPVERLLELIVSPVADVRGVLVLLLDGLDLTVWRQLFGEITARGWTWWQPEAAATPPMGIATLPSVTACSRASLFAGAVRKGDQGTEREDFAQHSSLRTSGSRTPVLFHKGNLGAANALAPAVRDAIATPQLRVVGVVVNAVDDWLDRSDQTLPRWSVSAVPLLDALLQEAAAANRAIVILSDHGHILDYNMSLRGRGEGARWRLAQSGPLTDGEILATGNRVREATGQDAIVLAWSEGVRYAGKQAGYHGGASAQEIVAPVAVLSRDELAIGGWRPVADLPPAWWNEAAPGATPTIAQMTEKRVSRRASPVQTSESIMPVVARSWIDAVLKSTVYVSQRSLAGRTAPRDEQIRLVLETLDRFQDRAPRTAIAAALGLPEVRVRGLIAGVRRVLNVEGFAVLEEEESTGTLLLNRALLGVQFGVPT